MRMLRMRMRLRHDARLRAASPRLRRGFAGFPAAPPRLRRGFAAALPRLCRGFAAASPRLRRGFAAASLRVCRGFAAASPRLRLRRGAWLRRGCAAAAPQLRRCCQRRGCAAAAPKSCSLEIVLPEGISISQKMSTLKISLVKKFHKKPFFGRDIAQFQKIIFFPTTTFSIRMFPRSFEAKLESSKTPFFPQIRISLSQKISQKAVFWPKYCSNSENKFFSRDYFFYTDVSPKFRS
jgi:hypothetical protein